MGYAYVSYVKARVVSAERMSNIFYYEIKFLSYTIMRDVTIAAETLCLNIPVVHLFCATSPYTVATEITVNKKNFVTARTYYRYSL